MLDQYVFGSCERISPEAPVPILKARKNEWRMGGAANVAAGFSALEASSVLIGVCGKDDEAKHFERLLAADDYISAKLVGSCHRPTTVKSRFLVGSHQMFRVDKEEASDLRPEDESALLDRFYSAFEDTGLVVLSDYNKGTLTSRVLAQIVEVSSAAGIPTIVDPKVKDFSRYQGVSFIKPNRKEAEQATGITISDYDSLYKASELIADITKAEAVITTLSEDGVGVYDGSSLSIIPTRAKSVFDVTGAGDTFLAAFSYNYLKTGDVLQSSEFANLAAAIVVEKIGSATASLEEIAKIKSELSIYEH